jgi:hypothetical protein
MTRYSKEFLEKTIQVWQPLSEKELTEEDAREIVENMTGLFSFLIELDEKYGKEKEEEKIQS